MSRRTLFARQPSKSNGQNGSRRVFDVGFAKGLESIRADPRHGAVPAHGPVTANDRHRRVANTDVASKGNSGECSKQRFGWIQTRQLCGPRSELLRRRVSERRGGDISGLGGVLPRPRRPRESGQIDQGRTRRPVGSVSAVTSWIRRSSRRGASSDYLY